jgi:hypothetical protein
MAKVDFHHVDDRHKAIHARLLNWSRWVTPSSPTTICPMFKQAKSNAWQWHTPEVRETVDIQDALKVERMVCGLPDKERLAIKWAYVQKTGPGRMTRKIASSDHELARLIENARQLLTHDISPAMM